MAMTTCSICKRELDQTSFHKNKQNKSGYDHRCKNCRYELHKKSYYKNIEKSREYNRKIQANNRINKSIYNKKSYVKERYGITVEDLKKFINNHIDNFGMTCEICGV